MNENPDQSQVKKSALKWVLRETFGNLFLIAILFGIVGRWDWWNGWALCSIYLIWSLGSIIFILPVNPEMLAERHLRGVKSGAKQWDIKMVTLMGLFVFVMYIICCLDVRFGWSPVLSVGWTITGLVMCVLGYDVLLLWSMVVNSFFTAIIRIQSERKHRVIDSGPYRMVRHPGYLGTILCYLFTPLLLGSYWGFFPALGAVVVLIVRTAMEDKTLRAELTGYEEYTQQTRYRLLPGIW